MSIEPYRAPYSHRITPEGEPKAPTVVEKRAGKLPRGQLQKDILQAISAAVDQKINAETLKEGLRHKHSLKEQIKKFTKSGDPNEIKESIAKNMKSQDMVPFFKEKFDRILKARDWSSYVRVTKVKK